MTNEVSGATDGLICAYDLDGQGGGRRIDWAGLESPAAGDLTRWIHINFSHQNARAWVRNKSGVPGVIADALLDEDSRPRVVEQGDGLLVILRGVNRNPGANPEDMVSIRVWIEKHRVLSARRRRLLSVSSIEDELRANNGPRNSSEFLHTLIEKLGERIEPVIDQLDESLEKVELRLEQSRELEYTNEFGLLRRQAMRLRRFLAPQRDGLERLSRQESTLLSVADRFEIREEADRLTRYLEDLDLVRERAMVAQENLLARFAQEQNNRIYILAIVAAIFLPLSFITGLMGMNVAGLPGTENPASFWILSGVLTVTTAAILVGFRLKKWL